MPSDAAESERKRLETLRAYEVMDTAPDPVLDNITRLVGQLLDVPTALVSLLDDHRQWFKSRLGMEIEQTDRDIAFCDRVVRADDALIVEDATRDARFAENPLVVNDPHVRFYAGFPLRVPEGVVLGTLCAIDYVPRTLRPEQIIILRDLATLAAQRLVLQRNERLLNTARSELELYRRFFEDSSGLNCVSSLDGRFQTLNGQWTELLGYSREELTAAPFIDFVHPDDAQQTMAKMEALAQGKPVASFRNRYRRKDGTYLWLEWNAHPTGRSDEAVFATAHDVSKMVAAEEALFLRNGVLSLITDAQNRFITDGADRAWWSFVLERMLQLTGSSYGFIGTVEADADGTFLRTKSITDIAWDSESRRLFESRALDGMVFRNMNTLFGRAITTKEKYISNDVLHDPHAGGRPRGHPPLNAFAGLPLKEASEISGLVGLANRRDGYDEELLRNLDPLLAFLAKVLKVIRLQTEQKSFVSRLEASRELQERVLETSETGFLALSADGRVVLANRRAREMVGMLRNRSDADGHGIENALNAMLAEPDARRWALALLQIPEPSARGPRKVRLRGVHDTEVVVELTATQFRDENDRAPGLLLAITDFRQRAALEDTLRKNASLEERVSQLRQQQRDNEILSECVEYLQRCANLDEGMELSGRSLERLFPTANISLYVARESDDVMMLRRETRRFDDSAAVSELTSTQCWALRTRRVHGAWPGGHHLPCQHTNKDEKRSAFCIPLFTLERNVAVFTVSFPRDESRTTDTLEARMAQFVALAQSVTGALTTIALRESLQRTALLDELTELSNRRGFQLEVGAGISRQRRSQKPFALVIADIDHFKTVNDQYGHDMGDKVLRLVAQILKAGVREYDSLGRMGGEEFAFFLPEVEADVAVRRLEALLQRLSSSSILDGRIITASIGLAHSGDFAPDTPYESLYKAADVALYRAKEGGRNRVVRADSSWSTTTSQDEGPPPKAASST